MMLIKLLILVAICVAIGIFIFRSTDPDPKKYRVHLGEDELAYSRHREESARLTLLELAIAAKLRNSPALGIANSGAYYSPVKNRVRVSRALLARLSDSELRLILAHEVGHGRRRWNRMALLLTASTPKQWLAAVEATMRAEPGGIITSQMSFRASALGVSIP